MGKVRLGDIFEYMPKSKIKAGEGKKTGKYKFFTSSNIQDKYIDEFIYDGEYLIFGTGGKASINYCNERFSTSTDSFVVKVKKYINTKFVYLYFKNDMQKLENGFKGASIKHISKEYINQLMISMYDLKMQEKVVKNLDKVQEIIDIRENQIEQLNELIKSQFVEMFQSGNYPKEELGKLCDVRDGTHDSPRYMEKSDYKFITSKNIINNEIDFSDVKYISKKDYDKFNTRSKVNYGDILMPMIGTIGKPMIVNIPDSEIDFAIKNVALIKFLDNSQVTNIYIKYLLDSDYFENAILQNKRGGTQKFIALSDIRKMQIEIPPIELQNQFAEIVKQIDKQKFEIQKSLEEIQRLQESLMNKYFG